MFSLIDTREKYICKKLGVKEGGVGDVFLGAYGKCI